MFCAVSLSNKVRVVWLSPVSLVTSAIHLLRSSVIRARWQEAYSYTSETLPLKDYGIPTKLNSSFPFHVTRQKISCCENQQHQHRCWYCRSPLKKPHQFKNDAQTIHVSHSHYAPYNQHSTASFPAFRLDAAHDYTCRECFFYPREPVSSRAMCLLIQRLCAFQMTCQV